MRTMRKRVVFAFLILLICAECQELDDGDAGKLFRNETTKSTDINTTAPSPNENNSTTVDVPTDYIEEDTQEERETQEEEETRDHDEQADQTTPGDLEVPEWTTVFPDDDNVISMKDVFEKSLDVVKDEMKGIGIIQSWLKEQASDLGLVPTEDYPTTDDLPVVEEEQQDVYDDDKTGITNFEDFEEKQEETTIPEFDMTTVLPLEIEGEILQKIEDDLEKLNHVHEEEIKEVKKKNEIITDIEKNLNELELISSHEVQETTSVLPSTTEVLTESEELTEVTETDSTVTNEILAEDESKQEMTIPEEEVNTEVMFIPTESSREHQTTEFIQETTTIDSVEYSDIPDLASEERSKSTEEETITENGLTTEVTTSSLDSNIAGEDQDEDLPVDDNHLKKEESLLKEAEEVIEQEEKLLEEQELESQKGQEDLKEEEEEDSTDFIKIVNQIDLEETSGSSEIPKFPQEITTEVTTEITPEMTTELTEVITEEIVPVQEEIEEEDEEEYKEEEKEEEVKEEYEQENEKEEKAKEEDKQEEKKEDVKEENDQENEQEEEKEEDIPEITLTSTEMITKTTESEDQNEQNMISTSTTITLLPQTEDPTTKLIVPEITTEQLQTTVYEGVTFVTQTSNVPNDSEDLSTSSTTSSTTTNPDRPTTPISEGHLTTVEIETPNDIIDEIVDEIIDEINILEQTTTTTTEDPTKHLLEETLNLTKTIDHLLEENDQIIKVLTSNKLPENNSKNNNNLKPEVPNDTEEDDEDDEDDDLIDFDSDDFGNDDTLQASNDKLPISDSDDWDSSEQDNEDTLEDDHSPKPDVDERVSAVIIDRMDGTICLNASGLSIKITTNNLTYWVPSTARAIGECTSFGAFLNFTWKNKEHEFSENNTIGFKFIGDEEEGYIEEVLFKTNTGILIAQQLERYFTEPTVISLSRNATVTITHANVKLSHKQKEYETVSLLNVDNALALQIASGGLCLFVVVIAVAIYSYRKLRSQERIFKVSLDK